MSRSTALLLALTLLVAALAAPAVAASTPTTAEDGGIYETGVALVFDVDGSEEYTLRTAKDDRFLNAFQSENGTVTVDTESMDPGEYVLVDEASGEVVYEFAIVTEKTETASPTATATQTETADPSTPATTTDAPGFGPVTAVIALFGLVALGRRR